jgi:Methyltransferase domain
MGHGRTGFDDQPDQSVGRSQPLETKPLRDTRFVSSAGDLTLQSYEAGAERYRSASPPTAPEVQALLDELAELIPGGTILEVGSGPGDDASYLEDKGVSVLRSDGARSFVNMMRADGHPARLLDVRSDDLGGPYDAIMAIAVLIHLSRDEFESFLVRARDAVPSGYLAFTLKQGDGDAWSAAKLDLPRHFTYWQETQLRTVMARSGWAPRSIAHVQGSREPWLVVLAELSNAERDRKE